MGEKEKEGIVIIISKHAWEALLKGKEVGALRVFQEGSLHYNFGDDPEPQIVRVRLIPVRKA